MFKGKYLDKQVILDQCHNHLEKVLQGVKIEWFAFICFSICSRSNHFLSIHSLLDMFRGNLLFFKLSGISNKQEKNLTQINAPTISYRDCTINTMSNNPPFYFFQTHLNFWPHNDTILIKLQYKCKPTHPFANNRFKSNLQSLQYYLILWFKLFH